MPARAPSSSGLMRPFVVLALPGMYLLYKYNQYRQQQMETARRRVTERELMHLNTKILKNLNNRKIIMQSIVALSRTVALWSGFRYGAASKVLSAGQAWVRGYVKTPPPCDPSAENPECRRAYADIPAPVDPQCPVKCERRKKKLGVLHRIKLRIVEGGTNFGTPFRRLECKEEKPPKEQEEEEEKPEKSKELSVSKKEVAELPPARPGVQVSVLGADTAIGQYVSLLLKQCPCIKKLRLYETRDAGCCSRDLTSIVQDLQHINTNCLVQAFSCSCFELERCLQNTDIVLMLESGYINYEMPLEQRFCCQAPIVKRYADAIANECPRAFVIVCATPIDCMVPLVAQTLRETGWYDSRKLLGSMAVPEMRASTLAARALSLEPRYTRVPCVGGTEGPGLVPLFSRAVEYFDFTEHNANLLTNAVRAAQSAVTRCDGSCPKAADLSEAHALAGLVTKVAHALLCHDVPRVTGFVETDSCQLVSPANYLAIDCLLSHKGICKRFDFPRHLSDYEISLLERSLDEVTCNVTRSLRWYCQNRQDEMERCAMAMQTNFHIPRHYHRIDSCADKLLNKLEENEPELATSPEEECVICVNAKATMETSPCGHRVVCRRCFVKTIQMAVSQRLLPLRCVICRAKILRLRQAPRLVTSKSWQVSSGSGKSWGVPGSVSSYSVGARSVPASASLYSVTSGESSLSGVSSVSSNSGGTGCSTKLCGGAKCGGACLGAVPRAPATASAPPRARQPASNSLRRSQHHSMKARLQEYQVHSYTGGPGEPSGRLPPIREFQREFREGRRESAAASASTRIRCAQKIVTQLETSPQKNKDHFFRPLKTPSKEDPPVTIEPSKETERKKDNPKTKPKKEDKKKKDGETINSDDKNRKDESSENRKNEIAERKKEEKLRLKAEKEAKKEAKQLAKEEERQAKLLAKEEERQAKLLAKEEKKKAKKEAKLAAQAEKEKSK